MRKLVSLLLAAVIAVGMSATAFAANPKITQQDAALADVDVGIVRPGTKIPVVLAQSAFSEATETLTASDVRNSKITVKHTVKTGSKAIESVELKENASKQAVVLVTLVDPFTSTKPLDFELTFTLYINGKRQSYSTTVLGTLENAEQEVYSDTDYIDLSDGSVAVCLESATKVEVYLGDDVTMFARMVKGKSYMGVASSDPTESDIEVLEQYPDIFNVYNLSLSGLTGTGNIVAIDYDIPLHVYDGDFNYLGTTNSMLPLSDKYFTSEKKLDVIEPEDDEEDFYGDEEEDYFVDSTDDYNPDDETFNSVSQSNLGGNPDTGVTPLFGISVAMGMLSLVAMGLVSFKKGK